MDTQLEHRGPFTLDRTDLNLVRIIHERLCNRLYQLLHGPTPCARRYRQEVEGVQTDLILLPSMRQRCAIRNCRSSRMGSKAFGSGTDGARFLCVSEQIVTHNGEDAMKKARRKPTKKSRMQ